MQGALSARIIASKQKFQAQRQQEGGKEYRTRSICDLLRLLRNVLMHHTAGTCASLSRRGVGGYKMRGPRQTTDRCCVRGWDLAEDRAAMGKDRSVAEYIASRPWFAGLVGRVYKIVRASGAKCLCSEQR